MCSTQIDYFSYSIKLRILLVNTKVSRKTKEQVEKVKQQYQQHRSIIEPILDSIDAVTQSFLEQIKKMEKYPREVSRTQSSHILQSQVA